MSLRTAIIGLGRIAYQLEFDSLRYHPCTHIGSLKTVSSEHSSSPAFVLAGASDSDYTKVSEFLDYWENQQPRPAVSKKSRKKKNDPYKEPLTAPSGIVVSSDPAAMLKSVRPEFVIIASPPEKHLEHGLAAIEAGAAYLLIEKPVCMKAKEALKLKKAAEKAAVSVWVNFERRYHPAYQYIKKIINQKKAGKLLAVRGRVLTGSGFDSRSGTGPLLHDAVHWLDLMLWYFGPPEKTESRLIRKQGSEAVFLHFHYPEFSVFLESSGNRRYFEFEWELDFERARIESGNRGHRIYQSQFSSRYSRFLELSDQPKALPKSVVWVNPWINLYKTIAKNANLNRYPDISQLNESITVLKIIEEVYK